MKRRLADARGVALTELALVLPLLLLILLGMLDFGKAFNEWIDETHLANDGARLAAVGYPAVVGSCDGSTAANPNTCLAHYIWNNADIRELQTGHGGGYSAAQADAEVCIYYPTNPATNTAGMVGDPVQVYVHVNYHWLNYIVRKLSVATTPITGQATMRLERQAKAGALSAPGRKTCYS